MVEPETKKFRGRIHTKVSTSEVQPNDVIMFNDGGFYCRFVKSVAKKTVTVSQPKGMKPKTKRVNREDIKECWRWRKKN